MYMCKSGFWQGIPNSSENVATMQHSTLSSGPSGLSRSQMLSSSLSGGSNSYSIPTASKLKAPLLPAIPFEKAPRSVAAGLRAGMGKGNRGQVSLLCVLAVWRGRC